MRSRNPPQPGEGAEANLRNALQLLDGLRDGLLQHHPSVTFLNSVHAVRQRVEAALSEISGGRYRPNPAGLVVYHNPPVRARRSTAGPGVVGLIGTEVHRIYYRNADGKEYVHPFEDYRHVAMYAVERAGVREIRITHEQGKPLWEEL